MTGPLSAMDYLRIYLGIIDFDSLLDPQAIVLCVLLCFSLQSFFNL